LAGCGVERGRAGGRGTDGGAARLLHRAVSEAIDAHPEDRCGKRGRLATGDLGFRPMPGDRTVGLACGVVVGVTRPVAADRMLQSFAERCVPAGSVIGGIPAASTCAKAGRTAAREFTAAQSAAAVPGPAP